MTSSVGSDKTHIDKCQLCKIIIIQWKTEQYNAKVTNTDIIIITIIIVILETTDCICWDSSVWELFLVWVGVPLL